MANLTETAQWEEGIYRIETSDPVIGGENGISNKQAKLLGNRTKYLKQKTDQSLRAIGSASLRKHCVITGKNNNGTPAFMSYTDGAGTALSPNVITINASALEPLVLSFSGGYDDNGPINYYKRITANSTINIPTNNKQYILATYDPATASVTFGCIDFLSSTYSVSYSNPFFDISPISEKYWYDLNSEVMKYYDQFNGVEAELLVIFLGTIDPAGTGTLVYYPTYGLDIMTLYGKGSVPAGTKHEFAGSVANIPTGYLLANGAAISRTTYANLFSAIGTTYGAGDGSTTFNIPDLRGEFIRGLDNSRGIDTDTVVVTGNTTNGSATISNMETTYGLTVGMSVSGTGIPAGATIASIVSRKSITISANATATGSTISLTFTRTRTLGGVQAHMVHKHDHMINTVSVAAGSGSVAALGDTNTTGNLTQMTGGSETRPRNVALNFIIKY